MCYLSAFPTARGSTGRRCHALPGVMLALDSAAACRGVLLQGYRNGLSQYATHAGPSMLEAEASGACMSRALVTFCALPLGAKQCHDESLSSADLSLERLWTFLGFMTGFHWRAAAMFLSACSSALVW